MKNIKDVAKKLKRTEIIELDEAYQKVLNWFFSFPDREIGLNDISTALKISKTTAKHTINMIVKEGFLKKEILGRIWRISCNKEHIYNYSRKVGYNLMMIYESGILEHIHKIVENPRAVILFGSYRKGDDNEKSDIDLAVEILGNEEPKIIESGIFPQFGHRKDVKVNLYIFSRNRIDLNLFSNIVNGIVLEGFLEARP